MGKTDWEREAALQRAVKAAQRVSVANAHDREVLKQQSHIEARLMAKARSQVKREMRKKFGDPCQRILARVEKLDAHYPVDWLAAAVRVAGVEEIAKAAGRRPATVRRWLKRGDPMSIRVTGEMLENIGQAAGIRDLGTWFDLFYSDRKAA